MSRPNMLLFSNRNAHPVDMCALVRGIKDQLSLHGIAEIPPTVSAVVLLPSSVEKPVAISLTNERKIKQIGFTVELGEGDADDEND